MSLTRLLRVTRQRFLAIFRKETLDEDLSRELAFHFDHLVQESLAEGLSLREARLAARKAIGNVGLIEEQCRDHRMVTWIHDLGQDLTYGVRTARRNSGFTAVAVASLALGIGASTAIFSVMSALIGDRLPIPDDDRLVILRTFPEGHPEQETHATLYDYFAWREGTSSFDRIGASLGTPVDFGADDGGAPPARIPGNAVTGEVLSALGVQPLLGRLFTNTDGAGDARERVVIISYRLWQRRFGGRPDILGQQARLNRVDSTIIGVMPPGFRYPNESADFWTPMRPDPAQVNSPERFFVVSARLKPGVTIAHAQSELDIVAERLAREDPDRHQGWSVRVKPVREAMFGWTRERLITLGAAVGLVLLVACANLAGLLLARGLARASEISLRTALGAARGRIVRQLLTESLLLSLAGGALGILVAWVGVRALTTMQPPPGGVRIAEVDVNPRILIVTAVIAIVTGLVFGLAPALMTSRSRLTDTLKEPTHPAGAGVRPRIRGTLVAAQIAVTFVLLVGSGLLLKSFVQVLSRDLQFDTRKLLTFEIRVPSGDYMHRRGSVDGLPYFDLSPHPSLTLTRVYRSLQAIPGVLSVAGASRPLLHSLVVPSATIQPLLSGPADVRPAAGPAPSLAIGVGRSTGYLVADQPLSASYFLVTPRFFSTVGASLFSGRDFSEDDTASAPWVAVVNESAARQFWPGQPAVGQRFTLPVVPDERPREVIGVVRDIPLGVESEARPIVYTSYLQQPDRYPLPGANMFGQMTFMLRSAGNPMDLLPAARQVVAEIDSDWPLADVTTMEQRLAFAVPQRRFLVLSIAAFALTATLLAAIGLYGVIAYSVVQRVREIGIRMTLGAGTRDIIALVGGGAGAIVVVGVVAGLIGSLGLTRLLRSQLWNVTPTDPVTFVAATAFLALVAMSAAYFPLRRATAVDPTVALRSE